YPNLIPRNGLEYTAPIFGSKYTMTANSLYATDIVATRRSFKGEPYDGIAALDLTDAVCMDIGANVGVYAIGMAARGAKKVYAFEPGICIQRMKQIVERNGITAVSCEQLGLGMKDDVMYWYEDKVNRGNGGLAASPESNEPPLEAKVTTLD